MTEAKENTEIPETEKVENKAEEKSAGTDEYGDFAGDDDFAAPKDEEVKKDGETLQNEYGEFAHEGMEGVNETIANETGEVIKERPPVGFTGSQPLNFLICSVIGTIIFAIYMDWEQKQKNKKPEGVTEVNKTGWKKADQTAEDWKKSGNQLFKEKDYEGAIVDYTMAIKIAKTNKEESAVFHVNRANAYFELDKITECLNDCTAAKDIDASYTKIYWRVAKVMEKMDKRENAIGVLKNAATEKKLFDLNDRTNAFTKYYNQLVDDHEQFSIYAKDDPTRNMFQVHCYWMHQLGANLDQVELKYLKNQLPTLVVEKDVEESMPVVFFPQALVVSLESMGEEIPAIAHLLKLQDEGESITQYEIAPLWFIHASRTEGHVYQMYSHIVCMTNHLNPGNFGKEEQACGIGSKLNKEIDQRKAHIKMCYNRIRAYLFQNHKIDFQFTEDEYTKYWQVCLTRGFTYPSDTSKGEASGTSWGVNCIQNNILRGDPYKANCTFMKNGDTFAIVTMKALKAGEELRYGSPAQPNGHLQYITTGCVEKDWFDRILIKTDIILELNEKTTPHYDLKKALMLESANRKEINVFQCMGNQNVFKLLIAWARFIVYDGDIQRLTDCNNAACSDEPTEYPMGQTLHKLDGFHGFNLFPRSLREEQKAWAFLEKAAKARMAEYSKINEDVELQKDGHKRNIKNILMIRKQEKANVNQLGFVSFTFMNELSKASPNLDKIDTEIKVGFRYQEYIDSIKDLPLEVQDLVSDSEEEVSDHDQADDTKEAHGADVEIVEEQTSKKEVDVDGE